MILSPDLHPDDLQARMDLRDQLREIRRISFMSCRVLSARLGMAGNTASDLEGDTSWTVRRVQAWARGLDHQLLLVVDGLTVPDTYDVTADLYATAVPELIVDVDRFRLLAVARDLVRIRKHAEITVAQMAKRLKVGDRSVRGWEDDPSGSLLRTVQRYTRALGGVLVPVLQPANVAVPL